MIYALFCEADLTPRIQHNLNGLHQEVAKSHASLVHDGDVGHPQLALKKYPILHEHTHTVHVYMENASEILNNLYNF